MVISFCWSFLWFSIAVARLTLWSTPLAAVAEDRFDLFLIAQLYILKHRKHELSEIFGLQ